LKQLPQTILDVGCGGGAFTMELARSYPQAKVTGIDISQQAISYANKQLTNQPALTNLTFQLTDKSTLAYPANQFDLVTATLVCHHLTDEELIAFLKQSVHIAKSAVILNDLHRHPLASLGFGVVAPLFFRNRLIWHDGLLSIKRSFKRNDWMRYLQAADIDLKRVCLTWHWPFRWILSINATDG
jgi:2-polyprenyl-3-methyl-5-hydroxy-6-metoxy-1,4-benzoquinol methylase